MTKQLLNELCKPYLIDLATTITLAMKHPESPAYEIHEAWGENQISIPIDVIEDVTNLTEAKQIGLLHEIALALRLTEDQELTNNK
jgi:hypothetical protein